MYNIGRSIRAIGRKTPALPGVKPHAFVFGAAPSPVVPPSLLQAATVVTTNASQVFLEDLGVEKPDITCMRCNMAELSEIDVMKLGKLQDRQTGCLVLHSHKSDPKCSEQLKVLKDVNYQFDKLVILDSTDCHLVYNSILDTSVPYLLKTFRPSMGLRSVLLCLAAGAKSVSVAGISFRSSGCSYSSLDYERIHVDGDLEIVRRIRKLKLPVHPTDIQLVEDTGLVHWNDAML